MNEHKTDKSDADTELSILTQQCGGASELLELIKDYRQIVGKLASNKDPREIMPLAKAFFTKKQKIRMATDLPEYSAKAFLEKVI